MAHENVIEMRDITKVFGEFVATNSLSADLGVWYVSLCFARDWHTDGGMLPLASPQNATYDKRLNGRPQTRIRS